MNVRETEYALRRAFRQCARLTGREAFEWWHERRLQLLVKVSGWRKLTEVEHCYLEWGVKHLQREAHHAHAV